MIEAPEGLTMVLGGIRSGKSAFAEELLKGATEVLYVATALPSLADRGLKERIELHLRRRPSDWTTFEPGDPDEVPLVVARHKGPLLLDSLGSWVGAYFPDLKRCPVEGMKRAFAERRQPSVVVSEEAGLGVIPLDPATRKWVDLVGELNQELLKLARRAYFVVAGRPILIKEER